MEIEEINSIAKLLNNSEKQFSSRIALSMRDKCYTYNEVKNISESIAAYLQALGVTKGDNIAILSENKPELGLALLGIIKTGSTAIIIDSYLKEEEFEFILKNSEATYVFISDTFTQELKNISGSLPNLKGTFEIEEIHKLDRASFSEPEIHLDDIAVLVYTSGTTGTQKGVMLSHGNIISAIIGSVERVPFDPGTNFLSLLPLSHMFGLLVGFLGPLYNGGRVAYTPSLKGIEILDTMQKTSTNVLVVVPLMLERYYSAISEKTEQLSPVLKRIFKLSFAVSKLFQKIRINPGKVLFRKIHNLFGGHLRYFICGGAPLEIEIENYFYTLGIPVLTGYGLTEASPSVSINTLNEHKIGSVGKLIPKVEVKITEENEILVKGPNIMKGYYKDEAATNEVLKSAWFYTGDLGEMDSDGYLYIKGRKKNVIVTSSGLKIFPEEIEGQVLKSPYINEICVLGKKVGKEEQAFGIIYPNMALFKNMQKEKVEAKIKEELEEYQKSLALYKKVRSFEIWNEELPKTTTKKIKRNLLLDIIDKRKPAEVVVKQTEEMDSFASKIRSIVSGIANVPVSSIGWESNLSADLGIESLMKIELLSAIDNEFGVYIPEEYSYNIETFKDLVKTTQIYSESPKTERSNILISDTKSDLSDILKENRVLKITRIISSILLLYISKIYFRLKVRHKERVPDTGSFILAANHTSLLDFPLTYISLPLTRMKNTAVPAAKDYFFKNQLTSFLVRMAFNAFPLERYGNFFEGLNNCATVIKSEKSLIMFPEGTRSQKGTLQSFKPGIGMLAFELDVPVLPVYIKGAYEAFPKGAFFPAPRSIEIRFGNPIIPNEYMKFKDEIPKYKIYQKIIEEVRKRVEALMDE